MPTSTSLSCSLPPFLFLLSCPSFPSQGKLCCLDCSRICEPTWPSHFSQSRSCKFRHTLLSREVIFSIYLSAFSPAHITSFEKYYLFLRVLNLNNEIPCSRPVWIYWGLRNSLNSFNFKFMWFKFWKCWYCFVDVSLISLLLFCNYVSYIIWDSPLI